MPTAELTPPTHLLITVPEPTGFVVHAGGKEVLRIDSDGKFFIRGELVGDNKEAARRLLASWGVIGVVQPDPTRSRLERILDDD